jgi:predicted RNase H-like HicB family nuclease
MQLASYTCWKAKEGGYIGYLNQYPDYWTQGDSIEELEKMLVSLYGDIIQFDDIQPAVPEQTGFVAVPV